jgi:hypothetical protein
MRTEGKTEERKTHRHEANGRFLRLTRKSLQFFRDQILHVEYTNNKALSEFYKLTVTKNFSVYFTNRFIDVLTTPYI